MKTIHRLQELRAEVRSYRNAGKSIGLVPTMGNLHDGHLSLVEKIRHHTDRVIATIFVNPMQFVQGEDFDTYPRTLEADAIKLSEAGVDVLFAPQVDEMFSADITLETRVEVPALDNILCGEFRPGHFTGVATIVTKLFNMVQPDKAIFGEKDYQQLLVIKRLVADLCLPVEILSAATKREADGLAMSSRNAYLNEEQRSKAAIIYQSLLSAAEQIKQGINLTEIELAGRKMLDDSGYETQYFNIRRSKDLTIPCEEDKDLVIIVAAKLGGTRLIDNVAAQQCIEPSD